jgi:Na+/proline symporter
MAEVSVVDYIIFALMLAISAGIGIFYGCFGKKNTTAKEMLVANRQMTVFPTAMSLLASFMSGITILGNPAESYNYGTMFVIFNLH